jgi:hypothetical protein
MKYFFDNWTIPLWVEYVSATIVGIAVGLFIALQF